MDGSPILGIAGRLLLYSVVLYLVVESVSQGAKPPSIGLVLTFAVLRMVAGALVGAFVLTQFADVGEGLANVRLIAMVVTRIVLWGGVCVVLGATSSRLAFALAGGMFVTLIADVLLPRTELWGLPWYC